ncbi:hypothetical protein HQ865_15025 [Mucilaginibacter mali]|uniref:Uncharacterized protein n=1 Tax=Mucilaginibacter mali TaxID=2740462 RepID=A0A7D4QL53_9SPHI|nr:hypothetical protein [Mucilaginibacter mali]QKJ31010.1 hypothetical protein HQ865_15025 [Mucilaginibacter mali]
MKLIITIFCFCYVLTVKAQIGTQHVVEPTGNYKQIDLSKELLVISRISDPNNKQKAKLIDSVESVTNNFTPSVLYILSSVLFSDNQKERGMFWFYVAQLRARYDVNRCADKTASAARYNQMIGPPINKYAFEHLDTLERIIARVIDFVRNNNENYDQRWINMEGMGAFDSAMNPDHKNEPLSIPKDKWAAIKAKTIEDYSNGFKETLASQKAKH